MKSVLLIALLVLLTCPAALLAKPVEVLVYPSGAIVTEQSTETVVDGALTLSLPEAADPDSLKISAVDSKAAISGLRFESVLETAGDYRELKDQIDATKEQLQAVEDDLLAKARTLELWRAPLGAKFQTAGEFQKLADMMLANTEKLYKDQSRLEKEKKTIKKKLDELEKKLADATSQQKRTWAVHVSLTGAKAKEDLRYSYRVRNADWHPLYTLDARPKEKSVLWDWSAQVRQGTAVDWKDVRLLLATAEPVFTLTPPEIEPWIIREARPYAAAPMAEDRLMAKSARMEAMPQSLAAAAPAPQRRAGTLFDIYDLGRQTLLAGESYKLGIRKGSWPAKFDYLIRPLESPQAFLSAKLEFDEMLPMPSGQAATLVEGVFVGHRQFALQAKKLDLPFGNDPQIQVKVTPTKEADEGGIFSHTRSQAWHWAVEITNNKSIPVQLRIEDSTPQIEDKRIKLTKTSADNAAQEDHLAKWEITLQPGAKQTISYGYKIEYPADMHVELGR